jgi:hypothetical protein
MLRRGLISLDLGVSILDDFSHGLKEYPGKDKDEDPDDEKCDQERQVNFQEHQGGLLCLI